MPMRTRRLSRRSLLQGAAVLGGAAVLERHATAGTVDTPSAGRGPLVVAGAGKAVVDTTAGKVAGFVRNGVFTFKGIPYGASTAGAARFLPASRPAPWAGTRSCRWYGEVCPQDERVGWKSDEEAFMFEWDDGQPGEDCLRVNVWTPAVNDNGRRPVLFWIHGGGFRAGSGQELKAYDGENMARRCDVVVVSVNHRLNVLGFLNLAEHGERYSGSANVGMLDLVTALEWVRDNIERFGGDPGRVLIHGQSGGGGKTTTLLAMPGARGLVHRAVVQSGSDPRAMPMEASLKLTAAVLAELGLSRSQVDQLHTMPYERLRGAASAGLRKIALPGQGSWIRRWMPFPDRNGWGPVVDGRVLPDHPWDPVAPAVSAQVPMLIGNCLNEHVHSIGHPELESTTEAELERQVSEAYGADKAGAIIAAYRKLYPQSTALDVLSFLHAAGYRHRTTTQAERKMALGAAPAWTYYFTWITPVLDGRPRAFHCAELPFMYYNTDRAAAMTGGGDDARALSAKMADAWAAFARNGDPNHAGLPRWPVYNEETGPVMVFDDECEVKNDPDREARRLLL